MFVIIIIIIITMMLLMIIISSSSSMYINIMMIMSIIIIIIMIMVILMIRDIIIIITIIIIVYIALSSIIIIVIIMCETCSMIITIGLLRQPGRMRARVCMHTRCMHAYTHVIHDRMPTAPRVHPLGPPPPQASCSSPKATINKDGTSINQANTPQSAN